MNTKISKDLFDKLTSNKHISYTVGSTLHNNRKQNSDTDYVLVLSDNDLVEDITYQYNNGTDDFIIVNESRFNRCREDGSDIVFFEADPIKPNKNIIRAYLGLAKRDWKEYIKTGNKKKKYHAIRCYCIASSLYKHGKPQLDYNAYIAEIETSNLKDCDLPDMYNSLRRKLNE